MYKLNGGVVHGIKLSAHIYFFFVVMWLFTKQARSCYSKIQNIKVVHHVIMVGKLSFFIYLTELSQVNIYQLASYRIFKIYLVNKI